MMRSRGRLAMGAVVMLGLAVWCASGPGPSADAPKSKGAEAFDYVGVANTVARINVQTGAIDVLIRGDDTRVGIRTPGGQPWSWRPVRIKTAETTTRPPSIAEDLPDR